MIADTDTRLVLGKESFKPDEGDVRYVERAL